MVIARKNRNDHIDIAIEMEHFSPQAAALVLDDTVNGMDLAIYLDLLRNSGVVISAQTAAMAEQKLEEWRRKVVKKSEIQETQEVGSRISLSPTMLSPLTPGAHLRGPLSWEEWLDKEPETKDHAHN